MSATSVNPASAYGRTASTTASTSTASTSSPQGVVGQVPQSGVLHVEVVTVVVHVPSREKRADDLHGLVEHLKADVCCGPSAAHHMLVEVLAGTEPETKTPLGQEPRGDSLLGHYCRVVARRRAGHVRHQGNALGGLRGRAEHAPGVRGMALGAQPREGVVGGDGEVEPDALGTDHMTDEVTRSRLLRHLRVPDRHHVAALLVISGAPPLWNAEGAPARHPLVAARRGCGPRPKAAPARSDDGFPPSVRAARPASPAGALTAGVGSAGRLVGYGILWKRAAGGRARPTTVRVVHVVRLEMLRTRHLRLRSFRTGTLIARRPTSYLGHVPGVRVWRGLLIRQIPRYRLPLPVASGSFGQALVHGVLASSHRAWCDAQVPLWPALMPVIAALPRPWSAAIRGRITDPARLPCTSRRGGGTRPEGHDSHRPRPVTAGEP